MHGSRLGVVLGHAQDTTARVWDTRAGACSSTLAASCAVHAAAACPHDPNIVRTPAANCPCLCSCLLRVLSSGVVVHV